MKIFINRHSKVIATGSNLQQLLNDMCMQSQKGIAVAVNEQVFQKSDWENHRLKENDQVMIIKATQGG